VTPDGHHDRIPVLDLSQEIETLWAELSEAVLRVLRCGQYVLGPEVAAFEAEAAAYLGTAHAVGVNSGTDALVIGLRSLGVGPGDEVVTSPFTYFATAEAISLVGAKPVFADVEAESLNLDPERVEAAVTERTRALLPVHLFGRPAAMDPLLGVAGAHGLRVLEDCAQSFGARTPAGLTGTIGDAGAFSFYPTKNLGGFGDGGLLATDDEEVAETARMLRTHGERHRYQNEMLGYNSRLDAMQAALLRVKLSRLDEANTGRRLAAERYVRLLRDAEGIETPPIVDGHVFHQFTVRVTGADRDAVRRRLDEAGVGTMVYYPVPIHRLPVYAEAHAEISLPIAERAAREVLSLPIWPGIPEPAQERVAETLRRAVARG
jgi:dTDP-4-amino-4,6-dideoxygalactose transaminase